MNQQNEPCDRVESYLLQLRAALGRTQELEKAEIISDIRCHIAERVEECECPPGEAVTLVLEELGDPESLARTYRAEGLPNRTAISAGAWLLARAVSGRVFAGTGGFFSVLALFVGYSFSLLFLACAGLKPFFPGNIGLVGVGGRDPLGYWNIPLLLVIGLLFFVLTGRFRTWVSLASR